MWNPRLFFWGGKHEAGGGFTNEMFVKRYEMDINETAPSVDNFSFFSGYFTSLRTSG